MTGKMPGAKVIAAVCEHFGVTRDDLKSPARWRPLAGQRQVAMWLLRDLAGFSRSRIGKMLGRNHTTVLHGCRRIERLVTTDKSDPLAQHAFELKRKLTKMAGDQPNTCA